MAVYFGFSTQHVNQPRLTVRTGVDGGAGGLNKIKSSKTFTLTDEELVLRDFINSFNIRQGEKPGNPEYGTTLWSFVFEPNTQDVQIELEKEVRRLANLDPRITMNSINTTVKDAGILIELEMAIQPFNQAFTSSVFLDQKTSSAFGS